MIGVIALLPSRPVGKQMGSRPGRKRCAEVVERADLWLPLATIAFRKEARPRREANAERLEAEDESQWFNCGAVDGRVKSCFNGAYMTSGFDLVDLKLTFA